jgi:TRAP transporter TAXI family solute receptor
MRKFSLVVALAAVVALVAAALWYASRDPLPPQIRIAAGKRGGLYHTLALEIAKSLSSEERTGRPVLVVESPGTEANLQLLRDRKVELALIQKVSATPEGIAAIAPLFSEPLHIIVRRGKGIASPKDLAGHRLSLGLRGSTMRQTSLTLLAHYGVPVTKAMDSEEHFGVLVANPGVDAALVTTGWMNPIVAGLLQRDDLELIGIDDSEGLAMRHPWLTAVTLPQGLYPGKSPVPAQPVRTVAVTALLACRADASDRLVREALEAIYETDLRSSFPAVLSAKAAKDYDAAVMHPAVVKYHDPAASLTRLAQALELVSKSKEAVFGVGAVALLIWGWVRRRRERVAAEADRVQRQKLDDLIGRTLTVELEQMDVTDPEQLRPFLRRVTQIKQEALRELTSEKVRGDQLFAIFLSQCAALSEKIQMRMLYGRMSETVEQV